MNRSLLITATVVSLAACGSDGTRGPAGPAGAAGPTGDGGPSGTVICATSNTLSTTVAVSSPANGSFFTPGEKPVVTITFKDACGQTVPPASLGSTVDFFVVGPRAPLLTVTAYKLLNLTPAPFRAQGLKPLADGGTPSPNMTVQADGTVVYTLSAITDEKPGTYTASVWAIGPDPLNQMFVLQDFQIGTATVEPYATGPVDDSSCASCHRNAEPGGKTYMAHIAPGFSPVGNYALDSLPIGNCKACHNNAGYSPNPLLRKTHGVHRGEHQLSQAPGQDAGVHGGAAHPEYGFGPDTSLYAFNNVGFPLMPLGGTEGFALPASVAMEKNCTGCHVTDTWKTNLSRAACGTCHDNLYYAGALLSDGGVDPNAATAVLSPPTVYGPPSGAAACTNDASCAAFSTLATCNTSTGNCELKTHAKQTDDTQCATCHAETSVISSVTAVHGITPYAAPVSLDGYTFKSVSVTGADGGVFNVGDTLTVKFQLFDNQATPAPVIDLATNSAWAGTFLVAGPTSNPQRVFGTANGGLNMKTGLTYDTPSQTYTYVAGKWPQKALIPLNNAGAGTAGPNDNPPGNYTVWFYWAKRTPPGTGTRDAVDTQVAVPFQVNQKASGRQVVTQAACGSCHGLSPSGFPHLALHGGQRKNGETCSTCHTQFALDRGVGAAGVSCTTDANCPGFNANPALSWESCQAGVCTVTQDPTPGASVDYQQLVHNLHFARLREGALEQGNLFDPGTLQYLGNSNSLSSFQEILSPVDVRSCGNCHADSNAACSANAPCGYGQSCVSGKCQNVATQNPTARACITCHDAADSVQHAKLNTDSSGTETCVICHGPDAPYSVANMHNITSGYNSHLAYPRE